VSSKKLGGLDKKISNDRFNIRDKYGGKTAGILAALSGSPGMQQAAMQSEDVVGARAGDTGTSSAARDERRAGEASAEAERQAYATAEQAAAARRQQEEERRRQEEEARQKLREAQGGGFTANILAGAGGRGRGARRYLTGS